MSTLERILKELKKEDLYKKWKKGAIKHWWFRKWCLIAAPFIALFTDKDWNLPEKLKDYQTPDSTMNGGGWHGDRTPYSATDSNKGGDQDFYDTWMTRYHKYGTSRVVRFFFRWLISLRWQWRNTGHGYPYYTLGFQLQPGYTLWKHPLSTKDSLDSSTEGWFFWLITNPDGSECFTYYRIEHYSKLNNKLGHRQYVGWRLTDLNKEGLKLRVSLNNHNNPFKSS